MTFLVAIGMNDLVPNLNSINPSDTAGLIRLVQNDANDPQKCLKPQHMGTHLRVLSKSYPMNTDMTGFRWF